MPEILKNISYTNIVRNIGGVMFGDVTYQPRGEYGPRIQPDYQLVLLLEGSLELRIDKRWMEVAPGEVVLCEPGHEELFIFSRKTKTHHQWCSVSARLLDKAARGQLTGMSGVLAISETLHSLVQTGLRRSPEISPARESVFQHLGMACLQTFLSDRETASGGDSTLPGPLQKALRNIHERYAQEWSLESLSLVAGVSHNHLIKLFRDHLSTTPMEYLWQTRLDHAYTLLRETGLSVGEIAYRTGFQNPFHFSRRYKARYGLSPRIQRQRK